ncbi:MAG: sugar ABC transporter permease [Chloroflexota bacterium]|nr:sugar ABC transporter permease [Chloroflexota bacterium]
MIAPMLLGLCIFYVWPALQTLYFSFTEWGAFGKYQWSGADNYQRLLRDAEVWQALRNTLLYTALSVPISIALAIGIAVLLNQHIRGVGVYRTLFFLPAVTMPAAIAMVWQWLFNGDYGLINYLLSFLGLEGPRWLSHPRLALYSVVAVGVWASIGSNMVIFLSGLQGIPRTYYEAAEIDGAGPFRQFFRITLPLLTPTIFFATVLSLISAFQVFDLIYLMIGPNSPVIDNTQSVVYLFFEQAFLLNDKGYAATIIMLLFVIILAVTSLQFRLQRRWVHYG